MGDLPLKKKKKIMPIIDSTWHTWHKMLKCVPHVLHGMLDVMVVLGDTMLSIILLIKLVSQWYGAAVNWQQRFKPHITVDVLDFCLFAEPIA